MSELRRGLEKVSKRSLVIKHSMAKKVLQGMGFEEAVNFLEQQLQHLGQLVRELGMVVVELKK